MDDRDAQLAAHRLALAILIDGMKKLSPEWADDKARDRLVDALHKAIPRHFAGDENATALSALARDEVDFIFTPDIRRQRK